MRKLNRRQRILFRLTRQKRRVAPCDRLVRGTFSEVVFASGVARPATEPRFALYIDGKKCPGVTNIKVI